MEKMTITEALAEIKTVGKRLEKKRASIANYLARDNRVKDPLEKEGGSVEFVRRERQGIADLEERVVAIRTAIQKRNLEVKQSIGEKTRTIAEWLTWRREISVNAKSFLNQLGNAINGVRNEAQKKGTRIASSETEGQPGEVIVNLNEKELLEQQEQMEKTLGDLDGKLSLLNATTVIEF